MVGSAPRRCKVSQLLGVLKSPTNSPLFTTASISVYACVRRCMRAYAREDKYCDFCDSLSLYLLSPLRTWNICHKPGVSSVCHLLNNYRNLCDNEAMKR